MPMKNKKWAITLAALFLILATVAGLLWYDIAGSKLYNYPVSVGGKTYTITIATNWNSEPKVSLSDTSISERHAVYVDFSGSCRKTVHLDVTIPTDLLSGNISLTWKYYPLSTDQYTLSNNGTHNSVQFKFESSGYLSGEGHFEIVGTQGVW